MTLVDARGRLFGLVNLIDLAMAAAVAGGVGVGAAAYRVFDIPTPELDRVEPAEVVIGTPRLTLVGRHFRHYLHAYIPRSDAPFAVTPEIPQLSEARFASVTDDRVELALPALAPGTYDLHLFDNSKRVVYRPKAFTVVPPRYPRARMDIHVLLFLPPGNPTLVKPGDQDIVTLLDPAVPPIGPAQVTAVRIEPDTTVDREIAFGEYQKSDSYEWFREQGRRLIADVSMTVPVVEVRPGRWEYKKKAMRVGETFMLKTATYTLAGPIVMVGDVQPWR